MEGNKLRTILNVVSFAALLVQAQTGQGQMTLQWHLVHPGVWKATVGKPEDLTLLKAADVKE